MKTQLQTSSPPPPNRLPKVLESSKLSWKPLADDQTSVPRVFDAWNCRVGGLTFDLGYEQLLEDDPDVPGRLIYELAITDQVQTRLWEVDSLRSAALIADTFLETLLHLLEEELKTAKFKRDRSNKRTTQSLEPALELLEPTLELSEGTPSSLEPALELREMLVCPLGSAKILTSTVVVLREGRRCSLFRSFSGLVANIVHSKPGLERVQTHLNLPARVLKPDSASVLARQTLFAKYRGDGFYVLGDDFLPGA